MGLFDKLFGTSRQQVPQQTNQQYNAYPQQGYQPGYGQQGYGQAANPDAARTADEQAIARYKYLLQTAPPEQLEQAHAEAFSKLTPQQRQQVLDELRRTSGEQIASDDPTLMARAATRAELRQPGYMTRSFGGGMGGGMGMGSVIGGSMLGSIAGVMMGTALANMMMGGFHDWDMANNMDGFGDGMGDQAGDFSGGDPGMGADQPMDAAGAGDQALGGDQAVGGGNDFFGGGGDFFGGGGGDFFGGGGDFGGDFGGGDF